MDEIAGRGKERQRDATPSAAEDWSVEIEGERYAGIHLLVEFWKASHIHDAGYIERALIDSARSAGTRVLESSFHKFSPSGGVTGVVLLAESHISIHTWPEHAYAAIDIFMCGGSDPHDALPELLRAFEPERHEIAVQHRGKLAP